MKNLFVSVLVASVCLVPVTSTAQAAPPRQGPYITQATQRLTRLIDVANQEGYILTDDAFSIGGGWIKKGPEWVTLYTVPLQAGKNYPVVAAGDNDARDVDVQILDANGNVVASDVATDADAVVTYRAGSNQRYSVRLRLYASDQDLPCVCLGILLEQN
jgi:hypothetical protein